MRVRLVRRLLLVCAFCALAVFARADEPRPDPLLARAQAIAALLVEEPQVDASIFGEAFLAALPPKRIASLARDFHKKGGTVVSLRPLRRDGSWSGRFELLLEKKRALVVTLSVSPKEPHQVAGLWFAGPQEVCADAAELAQAAAALPGRTALYAARLDAPAGDASSKPDSAPLCAVEADVPLAVGSAFKLWILGALADDVAEGRRTPADISTLRREWASAPSGRLQEWPAGAPVTLHTLATAMISESDNTATDHLLRLLGRGRVEALLAPMGVAAPERNLPLLSTAEMFRIKCGGDAGPAWEELDLAGRRARLAAWEAAPMSWRDFDVARLSKPTRIETVEWHASARDLARGLDWLRRRTEAGPAAPLREVLAVNPGLPGVAARFAWCGYKGGSEPGVLALAFLLRDEAGDWWSIVAIQNDPAKNLDESKLHALAESAARLATRR